MCVDIHSNIINKGKRTGILGGTFDPVHNGHIAMAETIYRTLNIDEILLMPSGIPPHKERISNSKDRLNMLRIATEEYPYMKVSDYEIKRKGTTYTADTLTMLNEENPDNEYIFIVGADSLVYMHKWYRPEIIFSKASIAVCVRNDTSRRDLLDAAEYLKQKFNADIIMVDFKPVNISSHELRECIAGQSIDRTDNCLAYINNRVLDYIYKHNLYIK